MRFPFLLPLWNPRAVARRSLFTAARWPFHASRRSVASAIHRTGRSHKLTREKIYGLTAPLLTLTPVNRPRILPIKFAELFRQPFRQDNRIIPCNRRRERQEKTGKGKSRIKASEILFIWLSILILFLVFSK